MKKNFVNPSLEIDKVNDLFIHTLSTSEFVSDQPALEGEFFFDFAADEELL